MISIKTIHTFDTYAIRHLVLREGLPLQTCFFKNDTANNTKHYGAYLENELIGVVSVYEESCTQLKSSLQFQVRGMAVLDKFQKKGVGKKLIEHILTEYKSDKKNTIWLNSREEAIPFYKKNNFSEIGTIFVNETNIPHKVMFQEIK